MPAGSGDGASDDAGARPSTAAGAIPTGRQVPQRPELARKYGVSIVTTVVAVAGDGTVLERLAP